MPVVFAKNFCIVGVKKVVQEGVNVHKLAWIAHSCVYALAKASVHDKKPN